MPKYIDADAFVKEKREWYCSQCEKRKGMKRGKLQFVYEIGGVPCWACDVADMISYIEDFPAADVELVRHGRWERKPDPYGFFDTIPVCSVCGCTTKYREESLCCPNCGAKMLPEPQKENPDDK